VSESVDLPPDWCSSNLEEVARSLGGGTPSKSDPTFWAGGAIPWVSPKDMKTFNVISSEDTLNEKALDRLSLIPADSVLVVVRSGILSRTLPVALNRLPVTINQDMRAFVPVRGISAKYLSLQLMAREREILSACAKNGTTVASIEGPALAHFPLAIAPAAQQTRIVAKLEELLSDLDAGVAELKAAQKKLAQYRQSLLKAAVEGSLTAEWRAKNTPTETGAQLLERILLERRARWEAKQLAKFKEQGKAPPKGLAEEIPRAGAARHHRPAGIAGGVGVGDFVASRLVRSRKIEAPPTQCSTSLWRAISVCADRRHPPFGYLHCGR
jgi:type I restriction enzyme S subunit